MRRTGSAFPCAENKPFLGLCLGAQLLARHLGARVFTHEAGPAEIGYYPLEATDAGKRLCAEPFPKMVYHWHRDGFDLPSGSDLLASGGPAFPVQAFRHGSGFGFQFHPEVTYAMMCKWTVYGAARLDLPGACAREAHLEGWFVHDRAVALWIDSFLAEWRRGALDGASAAAKACALAQA